MYTEMWKHSCQRRLSYGGSRNLYVYKGEMNLEMEYVLQAFLSRQQHAGTPATLHRIKLGWICHCFFILAP